MQLRDRIFAQPLRRETITVPEWGCDVVIHAMNGRDRFDWQSKQATSRGATPAQITARLVIQCAHDADGARLFTDADVDRVAELDGVALERVAAVAMRLNGMTAAQEADAEKKSETPSGDSGSGSPGISDTPTPTNS